MSTLLLTLSTTWTGLSAVPSLTRLTPVHPPIRGLIPIASVAYTLAPGSGRISRLGIDTEHAQLANQLSKPAYVITVAQLTRPPKPCSPSAPTAAICSSSLKVKTTATSYTVPHVRTSSVCRDSRCTTVRFFREKRWMTFWEEMALGIMWTRQPRSVLWIRVETTRPTFSSSRFGLRTSP